MSLVFTFSNYLNRKKTANQMLLLLYKNFDGFPKLLFREEVQNTRVWIQLPTLHNTNWIACEFMR